MTNIPQSIWTSGVELQRFLDSCGYEFFFIGGIAYQRWGEPRVTRDLDLTLVTEFGTERTIIEAILKRYQSRIPDPVNFALQSRILVLEDIAGTPIDLSIGGMPFESRMAARASKWGVPGAGRIRTCSAEDLVVLKAFAARPQDWIDIEKVIIRQSRTLDRDLIRTELKPLVGLKDEPEILAQLEKLYQKHPAHPS